MTPMTLRGRLCVSFVAAIALFCVAFGTLVWLLYPLGNPPPPRESEGELPPPPRKLLAIAYAHGGLDEVERTLRVPGEYFPGDAWVTLHRPDGTHVCLLGQEPIGRAEDVRRALQGKGAFTGPNFSANFSLTAPLRDSAGAVVAALTVEFGIGASPLRHGLSMRRWFAIVVGVVGGVAIILLLGLAFSAALARPVRNLVDAIRRMGPRRLEERVPLEGPLELVELSTSFNQLTEELQQAMRELNRQKELAQRMEASRREFLADVSHNLRTPLTAVQGWMDALRDGLVPADDTPRQLDRIQREVGHVIRTVQHLLDLARWESEEPHLLMQTFPVLDAVMEVAETLEESAAAADVSLQFDTVSTAWQVHADRGKVREIFQILLENAVKYAGPGTTVYLSMAPDDSRLRVVVRDDGAGIPPDVVPHLRERYHRASSGGIGLGLAIVYKLVRAHGGEVEIESTMGQGTRVEFSLPFVAARDGNANLRELDQRRAMTRIAP